jgi:hypothetical protein
MNVLKGVDKLWGTTLKYQNKKNVNAAPKYL